MSEIKINEAGIRELLNSDAVQDDLRRRMDNVLNRAKTTSPVKTGRLRASHVRQDVVRDGVRGVEVRAEAPYAAYVAAKRGWLAQSIDEART